MSKKIFFIFNSKDLETQRTTPVRNHWLTTCKGEDAGFFDTALWEATKQTGDEAVKILINNTMATTALSVVLIGSETYASRWVRYEIVKSFSRGTKMFGVHINSLKDRSGFTRAKGVNPFECLGIQFSADGAGVKVFELNNGKWSQFRDLPGYSLRVPRPKEDWGKLYYLSKWCTNYCWVNDNGYENFARWVDKV